MSNGDLARSGLLKDSEATLREVAGILSDLGAEGEESDSAHPSDNGSGETVRDLLRDLPALEEMVTLFFRTYREIVSVMESIRNGRGILHRAALERVQRTHRKIDEVSSATELAAADMLDGLDRALGLVDDLESASTSNPEGPGDSTGGDEASSADEDETVEVRLKEELHGLISILQFQDITAQQLSYASGVLKDVEDRLGALVELFEVHGFICAGEEEEEEEEGDSDPATFDPAATTEGADDRQALADEIFTV